jgi:AcrR family transcriptional regulator
VTSNRRDAKHNREHILLLARVLSKHGDVPAFNALARAAGVGVGTVYRHFADESALVEALAAEPLEALRSGMAAALADRDARAALARVVSLAVDVVMQHPLVAKLLTQQPAAARPLERQLGELIKRARRSGLRADVTVGDLRRLACGVELAATAGEKPREAAARYVDIVLKGMGLGKRTQRLRPA